VDVSRTLNGSAGISADMALKLADALGTSPELFSRNMDRHADPV
jgi:plasmid maintenance system antidote protein VapI